MAFKTHIAKEGLVEVENAISITLPSGHTVELFKNGQNLVVNILDGNGYGVAHDYFTDSQIAELKELVKLF
ncbi:hypothetical protein [Rossellomorea marisflavi]|uniref:hypothetical protein n=1 Tax=Rossellomorea marisflavi TaxID=189381 RepID=UPI003FA14D58